MTIVPHQRPGHSRSIDDDSSINSCTSRKTNGRRSDRSIHLRLYISGGARLHVTRQPGTCMHDCTRPGHLHHAAWPLNDQHTPQHHILTPYDLLTNDSLTACPPRVARAPVSDISRDPHSADLPTAYHHLRYHRRLQHAVAVSGTLPAAARPRLGQEHRTDKLAPQDDPSSR
nr:hypothetical protein CFP56_34711 [Quercus suber]